MNASVKYKSYIMPVKKKQKERKKMILVTARLEIGAVLDFSKAVITYSNVVHAESCVHDPY
jgi:hypothetical protein